MNSANGKIDQVISRKEFDVERKHFVLELCENGRGRFLRIVEEAHGRRNTIILPTTGLEEFHGAVQDIVRKEASA